MDRAYPVFVIPENMDDEEIGWTEAIYWCFRNLSHPNVLVLNEKEVYMLQYESEVLNIINDEIIGMLQVGENDLIMSQEHKLKILEGLSNYEKDDIKNIRVREMLEDILKLLKLAIDTNRYLYFQF